MELQAGSPDAWQTGSDDLSIRPAGRHTLLFWSKQYKPGEERKKRKSLGSIPRWRRRHRWKGWHDHGSMAASLIPARRLIHHTRPQYLPPSHTLRAVLSAISPSGFYLRGRLPDASAGHHSWIFTEQAGRRKREGGWIRAVKRILVCAGANYPRASEHLGSLIGGRVSTVGSFASVVRIQTRAVLPSNPLL